MSMMSLVPKEHHPGKWRLIVDLSSPKGASVNDGVSLACVACITYSWTKLVPGLQRRVEVPCWPSSMLKGHSELSQFTQMIDCCWNAMGGPHLCG